jgi:hypothetical protein
MKRYKIKCSSYEVRAQVPRRGLLNESRAPHHIQPEAAQLLQCRSLHDGVELQAAGGKSCCHCLYPNRRLPHTTLDYQNMIRWGSGHASPDVHADGAWVRLNLALSERGQYRLVGDQRDRQDVVQEKVHFPR